MIACLRYCFFLLMVRPLVLIVLGLNIRHRERLPKQGPAIIVANHNSHLDTMVLMTLFPLTILRRLRPVAALDYFMKSSWLRWFSLNIIGIIPLDRGARERGEDPLENCYKALERDEILILFPEGTRGEPEQMQDFKKGITYLAERFPEVPAYPIFLHGLGKALPKGEAILVPFFCDVFVGEGFTWTGSRDSYLQTLTAHLQRLRQEGQFAEWD